MNQSCLKKFFAWSGISNLGLMILCFSEFYEKINIAFTVYAVVYFFSVIGLLIFIINLQGKKLIVEWTNTAGKSIVDSLIVIVFFLSFLGLPPLSGFLAKLLVLTNLVCTSSLSCLMFLIPLVVLSAFIYLRVINLSFSNSKKNHNVWLSFSERPFFINNFILNLSVFFSLFFFSNTQPLILLLQNSCA